MSRKMFALAVASPPVVGGRVSFLAAMLALLSVGLDAPAFGADAAPVDFGRDIRPILAGHCYKCHGPDEKREADLRLDDRGAATNELPSGSIAIVPGSPERSELIARIYASDVDAIMPPPSANKPLNDKEKSILKRWIAEGAEYRPHWAFVPPARPPLPSIKNDRWPQNPIDAFILSKIEAEGLSPSPLADRYTLARRVSLDLVGLPPTSDELETFVHDSRPDAYAQYVERLLASPRYGERWARRWLDLARYADTNGYEKDRPRTMWLYRDWVIDALNRDMPFDRFTIEQFAGDMLPGATLEQQVATGFHRNTMVNEEGGIDPLEFRFYALVDRVATTGTVWLGLTMGCAQCHTHKYDPVTQREFYQLMAFFDQADEPTVEVPTPDIAARRAESVRQVAQLEVELPQKYPGGEAAFQQQKDQWIENESRQAIRWKVLRPSELSSNLPTLDLLADNSVLASGDQTKLDIYTIRFDDLPPNITALRLEALADPSLPAGGPGRVEYEGPFGDFFLSEMHLLADGQPVAIGGGSHDMADGGNHSGNAVDGNTETGWSINGGQGADHRAVFPLKDPLQGARSMEVKMFFEKYYAAALGRFRIAVTDDPRASWASSNAGTAASSSPSPPPPSAATAALEPPTPLAEAAADATAKKDSTPADSAAKLAVDASANLPADVVESLVKQPNERTAEDHARLARQFAKVAPELADARKAIDEVKNSSPRPTTALVMRQRPPSRYRTTRIHHRGEYLQERDVASPDGLSALHPWTADRPRDRLGLALWLVDRRNPLTARVVVNRQWATIFGRGLVRTTEDFGTQGEMPTHPELLDWLAVEFMESGWSLKQLHRTIVTSAAYQQSSQATPDSLERDPTNKWLSRGPRFRLDAELLRDAVLRASGLLSSKIGGPSVYPPQPAGITEVSYGGMAWNVSQGEDRYRRGLYTFAKRTAPYAMFSLFDAPSGEQCISRRERSNTALQALTLLNDEMTLDAARSLGRQMASMSDSVETRAGALYYRCLSRPASAGEIERLARYYLAQQRRLETGDLDAAKIAGEGAENPVVAAAWTLVARAILNLDAFVTKE